MYLVRPGAKGAPAQSTHTGDYHQNITGEIKLKWIENRLFPAWKNREETRDKIMMLVEDNASYNDWAGEGHVHIGHGSVSVIMIKLNIIAKM